MESLTKGLYFLSVGFSSGGGVPLPSMILAGLSRILGANEPSSASRTSLLTTCGNPENPGAVCLCHRQAGSVSRMLLVDQYRRNSSWSTLNWSTLKLALARQAVSFGN